MNKEASFNQPGPSSERLASLDSFRKIVDNLLTEDVPGSGIVARQLVLCGGNSFAAESRLNMTVSLPDGREIRGAWFTTAWPPENGKALWIPHNPHPHTYASAVFDGANDTLVFGPRGSGEARIRTVAQDPSGFIHFAGDIREEELVAWGIDLQAGNNYKVIPAFCSESDPEIDDQDSHEFGPERAVAIDQLRRDLEVRLFSTGILPYREEFTEEPTNHLPVVELGGVDQNRRSLTITIRPTSWPLAQSNLFLVPAREPIGGGQVVGVIIGPRGSNVCHGELDEIKTYSNQALGIRKLWTSEIKQLHRLVNALGLNPDLPYPIYLVGVDDNRAYTHIGPPCQFTETAQQVLRCAIEASERLQHDHLDTEHILLGLLEILDSTTLEHLGIKPDEVRKSVEHILGQGTQPVVQLPKLSTRARSVMQLAITEAGRRKPLVDDPPAVDGLDLLLASVEQDGGVDAKVLERMGVSVTSVRERVGQLRKAA